MHGEYPRGYYKIDSIIPTDARLLSERIASGEVNQSDFLFEFGNLLAQVRSASIFLTLQERKDELAKDTINKWFKAQLERPKGFKFDKIGSIGQHYGVKTTYLDATTDISVALFFATYNFQTPGYSGAGDRIIYRVKIHKLLKAQEEINKRWKFAGLEKHRAVDLSDTPEMFAPRALRQAGWSIIDFELSNLLELLIERGGITAFCFHSSPTQHPRNYRAVETIIPPDDSLTDLFGKHAVHGQTNYDLQQWFDQHVNPSRLDESKVILSKPDWIETFFSTYPDWKGHKI